MRRPDISLAAFLLRKRRYCYGLRPYVFEELSIKISWKTAAAAEIALYFMDNIAILYGLSHSFAAVSVTKVARTYIIAAVSVTHVVCA